MGHPASPNERFCDIIARLQQEICSLPSDVSTSRPQLQKLVDEAALIVTKQDSYLAEYSSPSLPIVQRMIDEGGAVDWDDLCEKGHTQFRLEPAMSAGGYEAAILCHFARMSKVRALPDLRAYLSPHLKSL